MSQFMGTPLLMAETKNSRDSIVAIKGLAGSCNFKVSSLLPFPLFFPDIYFGASTPFQEPPHSLLNCLKPRCTWYESSFPFLEGCLGGRWKEEPQTCHWEENILLIHVG